MDKKYRINIGCSAVAVLRELKRNRIGYCITQYNDGDVYFTATNLIEGQLTILDNMEEVEEVGDK